MAEGIKKVTGRTPVRGKDGRKPQSVGAGGLMDLTGSESLRLTLDPQNGAAVRSFTCLNRKGDWVPVLQPADPADSTADGSAMFPMVPFANRVRGNVLRVGASTFRLTPNSADPLAIHGFGWRRAWEVVDRDAESCVLVLGADPEAPIQFAARIGVRLTGSEAEFSLDMSNPGPKPIPAGLGWHPYFPHLQRTTLSFGSDLFWLEGPDHLPTDHLRVPPELDFSTSRSVPSTWRNNCYQGWQGRAVIGQPDLGYRLEMTAGPPLRHLMFYAPQSGVFALEPQSHVSGLTSVTKGGVRALLPGGSFASRLRLRVSPTFNDLAGDPAQPLS